MDIVDAQEQALDRTAALMDGVRLDQLAAPTPCEEWDVLRLIGHLVGGNRRFIAVAEGRALERGAGDESATTELPELAAEYRRTAEEVKRLWREPERLDRAWDTPFGPMPGRGLLGMRVLETVAHGWDLATATGQEPGYDAEVVAAAWAPARRGLSGERPPGMPFGPPTEPPEDAPEIDRLAAFLGRRV